VLSFWIGNLVGAANSGYGVDSTALVEIDGSQVFTAKNSAGQDLSHLVWQNYCVAFTAKSDSTTIGFVNGDPGDDTSNILDDVMLEPVQ
jgi:hypothetical protein